MKSVDLGTPRKQNVICSGMPIKNGNPKNLIEIVRVQARVGNYI